MRLSDWLLSAIELAGALRSQWHDTATLRAHQNHHVRELLEFAVRHIPYYRTTWAQRNIDIAAIQSVEQLARLPLLTRQEILSEPDAFLSDVGDRTTWFESTTSGTSGGHPMSTWYDPASWRFVNHVLKARRLVMSGWRPGLRLAVIAAPRHVDYAMTHQFPGERLIRMRKYLSLFDSPVDHLETLKAFRPHYMNSFPSYFAELAKYWSDEMRAAVPLKAMWTSGEWMHPEARRQIEHIMGVPFFDLYGSAEMKEMAVQCAPGTAYHINMESVHIEIVDDAGQLVPDGETGELIVTSLINRAMPLIRYQTRDRARRLTERCSCGRGLEVLDNVEGRVMNYLPIPELGQRSPFEFSHALAGIVGLMQFKILLHEGQRLEIQVMLRPDAQVDTVAEIERAICQLVGAHIEVQVRQVSSMEREPSGKRSAITIRPAPLTSEPSQ